jgi:hypothetical protein
VGGGIRGAGFGAAVRGADFANVIKQVFFEKKNQENFCLAVGDYSATAKQKFLLLFSKSSACFPSSGGNPAFMRFGAPH